MSMLMMSPSSSTVSSGMPWQTTSLIEVQTDFGYPRYPSVDGYASCATRKSWPMASSSSVVTPGGWRPRPPRPPGRRSGRWYGSAPPRPRVAVTVAVSAGPASRRTPVARCRRAPAARGRSARDEVSGIVPGMLKDTESPAWPMTRSGGTTTRPARSKKARNRSARTVTGPTRREDAARAPEIARERAARAAEDAADAEADALLSHSRARMRSPLRCSTRS